jgi:hypothetical protein
MKNITLALAALATVATAGSAQAAVITPVSATATSTFNNGWYDANNLINGSGLAASGLHDNFFGNMWMTDLGVAKAQLIFDLGAVYKLGSADIWQFNYADPYPVNPFTINTVDRGVKAFAILTSTDGVDYTEVYNGTMARANGDPASAQTFSFGGSAQYVKFDLFSNYAEGTIYDPYATGLSEVRFNTAAAVPEPASWAMMIGGLGLVGATLRRRRSKISFA